MDDEILLARLRTGLRADVLEHADHEADPPLGRMIATAVRGGRRRRATGRVLATTATAAATLAMVGAVSTLVWPISTLGGRLAEPAAPPTSSASADPTAAPGSPDDPLPLPATGRDVIDTLSHLLPSTFKVSDASSHVFPQNYEMHVGLTVTDSSGSAWVGAGIIAGRGLRVGCNDASCSTTKLDGGSLVVQKNVTDSKACGFTRYEYNRPTGGSVWFGQVNTTGRDVPPARTIGLDCDHTATRPRVPLTDQQVEDLLTDPAWDPLFAH